MEGSPSEMPDASVRLAQVWLKGRMGGADDCPWSGVGLLGMWDTGEVSFGSRRRGIPGFPFILGHGLLEAYEYIGRHLA